MFRSLFSKVALLLLLVGVLSAQQGLRGGHRGARRLANICVASTSSSPNVLCTARSADDVVLRIDDEAGIQLAFWGKISTTSVANGWSALDSLTSGTQNTAIGHKALTALTSSSGNTGIGYQALLKDTGGSNTAVGANALVNVTSGDSNVAVGTAVGLSLTSGSNNVMVGVSAGRFEADGSTVLQTNSSSTFIGDSTRSSANGNTNETVIGNGAIGQGSNTVVIGNSSVTKTILQGNVGIGDTSATRAKLVVLGSVTTDNGSFGFLNSAGETGTSSGDATTSIYADNRIVGFEINANSDRRIKELISPYENALETIAKLNVVKYNKRSSSGPAMGEVGLIGQELVASFPLALRVGTGDVPDGDGGWKEVDDFHTVNYQSVFMLAIRAIQEQQAQIDELRSRLDEFEDK